MLDLSLLTPLLPLASCRNPARLASRCCSCPIFSGSLTPNGKSGATRGSTTVCLNFSKYYRKWEIICDTDTQQISASLHFNIHICCRIWFFIYVNTTDLYHLSSTDDMSRNILTMHQSLCTSCVNECFKILPIFLDWGHSRGLLSSYLRFTFLFRYIAHLCQLYWIGHLGFVWPSWPQQMRGLKFFGKTFKTGWFSFTEDLPTGSAAPEPGFGLWFVGFQDL